MASGAASTATDPAQELREGMSTKAPKATRIERERKVTYQTYRENRVPIIMGSYSVPSDNAKKYADEDQVLTAMLPLFPPGEHTQLGPGDDAAVLRTPAAAVVASSDMLVEGYDFLPTGSSASDVGWKAAAQNISDIAAMGATPTGLLVSLGFPDDTDPLWVTRFSQGVTEACRALVGDGCGVIGGDLSGAPQIVVSITALGDPPETGVITRSGATPGDMVAVAGTLGYAAAGLAAIFAGYGQGSVGMPEGSALDRLQQIATLPDVSGTVRDVMWRALSLQRQPRPPVSAGIAAATVATSMIDLSDALSSDAHRIASASGVQLDFSRELLSPFLEPLMPLENVLQQNALDWVLHGGEEHSFLATFSAGSHLPEGFVPVGVVQEAGALDPGGVSLDGERIAIQGWDHFDPERR